MNEKILITGGRVIDPSQDLDGPREVLIADGRILDLVQPGAAGDFGLGARVIAAEDLVITPGLIDLHVHLREPGEEYKETIATGTAAAAAGGYTAVAAMPNTKPVNDQQAVTEFILARARSVGSARVWPVGSMTKGLLGEELSEYGDLVEAGVRAVSDDGRWVQNGQMMRRVLEYASAFSLLAISHAEDRDLSAGGVMNEGLTATRLGLAGQPAAAEVTAVFRDLTLSALTGARLHLAHISTARAVELIRRAKAEGLAVTAETAPHYFSLTEEAVGEYDTAAKMNPPLRNHRDVAAIKAGLADGTIDVIATDHAPHSVLEKEVEFDQAAFGIVGLETSLPLILDLVRGGSINLKRAIAALTHIPAGILGLAEGTLRPGCAADVTIIDLNRSWVVDPLQFKSKGRNSPFTGRSMTGRAVLTMVGGRVTHSLL